MTKKKHVFLALLVLLISACSDIDLVLPKGDKGDPGEKGLSAYQDWVSMVDNGVYPDWVGHTEKTDFMKFLTGSNGASAYDLWKDMISSGQVADPHNPSSMWDPNRNTKENFFEYLTGAKGDPGIPGSKVIINGEGNWEIDGEDTGVPARGQNGQDGDSAYEIWMKKVKAGEMPDKDDPTKPWDINKISLADFWEYFSGKPGKDGITPHIGENGNWWFKDTDTGVPARGQDGNSPTIGENGNWWIGTVDTNVPARGQDGENGKTPHIGENGNWWLDGIDTGVPARGEDGATPEIGENGNWFIDGVDTNKPSQGKGVPGDSAYELWKKEAVKGTLKNPHPDAIGYEGEFWKPSKVSLFDFWFYLRGRDGKDGKDGEVEIIKGKPNVIVEYYNSRTKEYIDPKDGSATFTIYDKNGVQVTAGITVKGLPSVDLAKSFVTDANGRIRVDRKYLPNKLPVELRKGITSAVTINGETLASASNTLVPNRVNTRLTVKDVYLRPNLPWHWDRTTSVNDFTVVKFVYEREIDGVWMPTETYKDNNELVVVHIKDINQPVSKDNIIEDIDDVIANTSNYKKWGNNRGVGGTSTNPTTPFFDVRDGTFLVYRPIVLTQDEKDFDISEGTRYPNDRRMDWIIEQLKTSRNYAWNDQDKYITLIGCANYYGEYPIMDAKIHNPEIYPSPSLTDIKYKKADGLSVLIGRFDDSTFAPVYKDFTASGNTWKATKLEELEGLKNLSFQMSMTKFTEFESGSTELSSTSSLTNLNFSLGSAYPNNVITTRLFSYLRPIEAERLGDCHSFYRLRPIFDFYNKGTNENPNYVLKDIYSSKEYNVPVIK